MKLFHHGACGEVTGSCHLLEVGGRRVLLDCGLFQGTPADEERNRDPFPFDPTSIDAVVLSHAHIDHSGRLPLLVRRGFRGTIHTQQASIDLCEIMLKDAAWLQEKDAEWANRKRERRGQPPVEPLYTRQDAEATLGLFVGHRYGKFFDVVPGLRVRLHEAGHILGSAIVELRLREGELERTLVFTGDLGHAGTPLLRFPARLHAADLVIMESTYGDRCHRDWAATWTEFGEVLNEARHSRGNILMPAFAVDRTQELLFAMSRHVDDWGLDHWHIFVDSPMAIRVTSVYLKYLDLLHEKAARELVDAATRPLLPHIRFTMSSEESMAINRIRSGALIIAGSGMCTGGRIMHHLKHNVWRPETHVIIVGFQAEGTLGRALVDGADHIRLWGEKVVVKAKIHTIGGLSSHADQAGLRNWYREFPSRPPVVLVHGEPPALMALADVLRQEDAAHVWIARPGMHFDLSDLPRKQDRQP